MRVLLSVPVRGKVGVFVGGREGGVVRFPRLKFKDLNALPSEGNITISRHATNRPLRLISVPPTIHVPARPSCPSQFVPVLPDYVQARPQDVFL